MRVSLLLCYCVVSKVRVDEGDSTYKSETSVEAGSMVILMVVAVASAVGDKQNRPQARRARIFRFIMTSL